MFKALFKKQFMELNRMYFQDNKTGKIRSPKAIIGFVCLMLFVFVSVGFAFVGISMALADALHYGNLDWLFFAMMGLMAIAVGVFGSVFTTYSSLYLARDNELLLSMPIPSKYLLAVRIITVYLSSLLYSALAWIPSVAVYIQRGYMNAKMIVFCAVLQILLSAVVTVLTCALGWVIAALAGRVKNKSIVTAVVTVAFMAGYYTVQFKLNSFLQYFAVNGGELADKISSAIKVWVYPMYQFGLAGAGNGKSLAVFSAITVVLCILCYAILSASFVKILTTNRGAKKTEYKEKSAKTSSAGIALIKKEFKRFVKSPTYLINGGLGLLIMPAAGIAALIKKNDLQIALEQFYAEGDFFKNAVPVFAVTLVCVMVSMNLIAPPSVSLEGRNIWVLQTLPVAAEKILKAKRRIPVILNTVPAIFCTAAVCSAMNADALMTVSAVAAVVSYIFLNAALGVFFGVRKANLVWTNEAVPIKQSSAVLITMFGGMAAAAAVTAGYYFLQAIPASIYLFGVAAIFVPFILILNRWISREGAAIFETL